MPTYGQENTEGDAAGCSSSTASTVMVLPPPTLGASTDDMDPMVEDNEDTRATASRVQFTDPDDSLPVSARASALRSRGSEARLVASDSSDEVDNILEGRVEAEMEAPHLHAGAATNAPVTCD